GVWCCPSGTGSAGGLRYCAFSAWRPLCGFEATSTLRLSPTTAAPKPMVEKPMAPSPADASAAAKMIAREEPGCGMQCPRIAGVIRDTGKKLRLKSTKRHCGKYGRLVK